MAIGRLNCRSARGLPNPIPQSKTPGESQPIDPRRERGHTARMTVTLSKESEQYVREQLQTGAFARPDDVVDALIALKPPLIVCDPDGCVLTRDELESELLQAVRGPHAPWRGREEIEEIRARVLARQPEGE